MLATHHGGVPLRPRQREIFNTMQPRPGSLPGIPHRALLDSPSSSVPLALAERLSSPADAVRGSGPGLPGEGDRVPRCPAGLGAGSRPTILRVARGQSSLFASFVSSIKSPLRGREVFQWIILNATAVDALAVGSVTRRQTRVSEVEPPRQPTPLPPRSSWHP